MYNQQSNGIETWVTSLINFIIWTIWYLNWYHKLLLHMLTAKIINIRPRWSQVYPHLASDMQDYSGIILTRLRLNDLITLRLIADKSRKRRREFWISIWLNQAQIQHCINPLIAQKSKKRKMKIKNIKFWISIWLNSNDPSTLWLFRIQRKKKKEMKNIKFWKQPFVCRDFPKKKGRKFSQSRKDSIIH